MRAKIVLVAALLVIALAAGFYVYPRGATPVDEIVYAEKGDAGLLYDAHESMRQFHYFRSLGNVSYRVAARNVQIPSVRCPKVSVVQVYSLYGAKANRYWLGCVEAGFM